MGRRPAVERIELIDPREPAGFSTAFAPSPPAPTPPSSQRGRGRRRRWPRVAAPLALLAIIAGVAIVVTLTDDGPAGAPAPPTSTSTSSSSASASTTIPTASQPPTPSIGTRSGPIRDSHLIGTLPPGLGAPDTTESTSGTDGDHVTPTSGALWADGVDASPGTRFVEVTASTERGGGLGLGTIRVSTPFGPAVAGVSPGRLTVAGSTSDGWATVQAAGLTLGEATHVLETVRIVDDRILTGGVAVPAGLHLVGRTAGTAPLWQSYTQTRASSAASDAPADGRWLSVEVGPQMTAYQQTVEWFFLSSSRTVDVGGLQATLGTSTATGGPQLTFDRNGLHIVIDATGIDDDDIVAYARSLHVADDATWHALLDSPPIDVGSSLDVTLAACASGTLPGPVTWSAKCGVDALAPTHLEIELDMATPNGPLFGTSTSLETSAPSIAAAATDRLSYVTAAVPAGVTGAVLRVLVGNAVVGSSSFNPLEHSDAQFAVVAFTDLEPFTAQIVAPDGVILAAYDPLTPGA